jgi:hypothetical protein
MINLSKNTQLSFSANILAFKWCQNIGDALSHLAHFSSFLSESQRQEAVNILKSFSEPHQDLVDLAHYVHVAPIEPNNPTIGIIGQIDPSPSDSN